MTLLALIAAGPVRIPPEAGNLVPVQPLPASSFTVDAIRAFFGITALALILVAPEAGLVGAALGTVVGGLYKARNQKRTDIPVPGEMPVLFKKVCCS